MHALGGPAPVTSPSAVPSPGGFSFAAAAAAGAGGAQTTSPLAIPDSHPRTTSQASAVPSALQREHSHQSFSLYSSKEGSRGSLSPTAGPQQPNAELHEESADEIAAMAAGIPSAHQKRKVSPKIIFCYAPFAARLTFMPLMHVLSPALRGSRLLSKIFQQ